MPCSWQKTSRSGDRSQRRDVMADRYAPDGWSIGLSFSYVPYVACVALDGNPALLRAL